MGGRRLMEWAARPDHLRGIPRRMVIGAVGAFAKLVTSFINSTSVHNAETLLRLVRHRPPGLPLITLSNHKSTLDDPLMWGFKDFPITDPRLARVNYNAGKCIPITRGGGIYQEHMNEALDYLGKGHWLHTFPEGKVSQEDIPIKRLKWGTASLIVRAPVTPLVLPIFHSGFEKVMPEKSFFGRRPPVPLFNKEIKIIIGEPIKFDLFSLRQTALSMCEHASFRSLGGPDTLLHGLDEAGQKWLYMTISEKIQTAMEGLRNFDTTVQA